MLLNKKKILFLIKITNDIKRGKLIIYVSKKTNLEQPIDLNQTIFRNRVPDIMKESRKKELYIYNCEKSGLEVVKIFN